MTDDPESIIIENQRWQGNMTKFFSAGGPQFWLIGQTTEELLNPLWKVWQTACRGSLLKAGAWLRFCNLKSVANPRILVNHSSDG
jgi:hypothetical protein